MIGFVLRYGALVFPVDGRMIAGRAPECDIYLDAVSVSRKHAAFTAATDHVGVEDLQSRNGVFVNGARLTGAGVLRVGDRVVLGSAVLVLALGERRPTSAERRSPGYQGIRTYRNDEAFPIFLDACARALGMGRVVEAAAGLLHLWEVLLEAASVPDADPLDPQVVAAATTYLIDIAERTGEPSWIDRAFDLRRKTAQPLDSVVLRKIVTVLGKCEGATGEGIRRYMAWLQTQPVGVVERIALRRLQDALDRLAPA